MEPMTRSMAARPAAMSYTSKVPPESVAREPAICFRVGPGAGPGEPASTTAIGPAGATGAAGDGRARDPGGATLPPEALGTTAAPPCAGATGPVSAGPDAIGFVEGV